MSCTNETRKNNNSDTRNRPKPLRTGLSRYLREDYTRVVGLGGDVGEEGSAERSVGSKISNPRKRTLGPIPMDYWGQGAC